jgi:hypothetical protein
MVLRPAETEELKIGGLKHLKAIQRKDIKVVVMTDLGEQ